LTTAFEQSWCVQRVLRSAGVPLATAKTRSFADLVAAVPEGEKEASVMIIGSATHFWRELCETYARAKAKERRLSSYRLAFSDWGFLKGDEGWGAVHQPLRQQPAPRDHVRPRRLRIRLFRGRRWAQAA
jgi:hypothetical protein